MTGSTLGTIVSIVVVVIVLVAGIAVVFYADAHPEWRHRAPSRHGIAGPPAVPHQEESPGLAARDTEASAAAEQDPGALARPQTGIYAGRARADLFRAAASAVRRLTAE
jgi:hypothetical protein